MVNKDPTAIAHKREMEELQQFVEGKHLPQDLANRVVKHFEFQHQKAVENRASLSVQLPRLPSPMEMAKKGSDRGRVCPNLGFAVTKISFTHAYLPSSLLSTKCKSILLIPTIC